MNKEEYFERGKQRECPICDRLCIDYASEVQHILKKHKVKKIITNGEQLQVGKNYLVVMNVVMKELYFGKITKIEDYEPHLLYQCYGRWNGELKEDLIYETHMDWYNSLPLVEQKKRIQFFEIETITKGGEKVMGLLRQLLSPDLVLLEKYAMNEEGNLDFTKPIVQKALLQTDGFKVKLLELCKEENKKKKDK